MSYRSLQIFLTVAEQRSFSAAARHLGVTPAAIGKAMKELERQFAVRLFHRNTHYLALTQDGERMLAQMAPAVQQLETVLDALMFKDEEPSGNLKLNLPESFGRRFILPLMPEFLTKYPKITLDIFLQDKRIDPIAEGFDLSIGNIADPDSRLIARQLTRIDLVTVANPDYLASRGTPDHPSDLANHACIAYRQLATGRVVPWRFNDNGNLITFNPKGNLTVSNIEAAAMAAIEGVGLATLGRWHTTQAIQSGQLVEVLERFRPDPLNVFLYYPSRENLASRVKVMIDFLIAHSQTAAFSTQQQQNPITRF